MPLMMAVGFAIMAWSLWGIICNRHTLRDRQALADAIYDTRHTDFYPRYTRILNNVGYRSHNRARMLLRDPWLLYPQDLAEEAKRRRK